MPGSMVFRVAVMTTAKRLGWMYFCANALDVGRRDRLDVLHVLGEVVIRQVVHQRVLEPS